ncbi:protein O-mannosyl-transferase TMTC2 [Halyomorpha halys]|uniref:protein O-mannosyl-transferase TMTC2 n=1 Tax=Halyomorpha halys TaxID=286706 RepID=UPI0006D4D5FA|nr:transmembrane and TPR repeat-containing protein 2 [Halyomorpha halys]
MLLDKALSMREIRKTCGAVKSLCWLGAGLTVLVCCRLHLMGLTSPSFATSDNPTARHSSFLVRTLTFSYLPAFNGLLLLFPRWLSFDWSMDAIPRIESVFDSRNLFSILFYGLFYLGMSRSLRSLKSEEMTKKIKPRKCRGCGQGCGYHTRYCKISNNNNYPTSHCNCKIAPRTRRESEAILISISILILPFIPASNLFFYVGFVVAERVLYLPSVGYCLLLGVGYGRLSRYTLPRIALIVLILSYSARTYLRNFDWQDEESLYRSGVHINPPKAYGNLGSVLSSQGRTKEAETAFRIALSFRPNMADVHYNL